MWFPAIHTAPPPCFGLCSWVSKGTGVSRGSEAPSTGRGRTARRSKRPEGGTTQKSTGKSETGPARAIAQFPAWAGPLNLEGRRDEGARCACSLGSRTACVHIPAPPRAGLCGLGCLPCPLGALGRSPVKRERGDAYSLAQHVGGAVREQEGLRPPGPKGRACLLRTSRSGAGSQRRGGQGPQSRVHSRFSLELAALPGCPGVGGPGGLGWGPGLQATMAQFALAAGLQGVRLQRVICHLVPKPWPSALRRFPAPSSRLVVLISLF